MYFLAFTWQGLGAYFNTDDLVNLNIYASQSVGTTLKENLLYFSPAYRPMGGLFYQPLFALFGLNPRPFRIVCFLFLGVNLYLVYLSFRLLTGSRETAALAASMGAFHARFVDLYWSSGTIYDILCFTYYFAALAVYWNDRRRGRFPGWRRTVVVLALYVCALDAKEMAVTLPLVLSLSEWICFQSARWAGYRAPAIAGLMTVPYIFGKEAQGSMMSHLASYRLHVSLGQYLTAQGVYLGDLFYREHWFTAERTATLLLLLLAAALAMRSRQLVFAWSYLIAAILPVAFIAPRAGFAFYLPMAGWCLYAALLLTSLRRAIARFLPTRTVLFQKAALFGLTLALLCRAHRVQRLRMGGPGILGQPLVRALVSELDRRRVQLPPGARVWVTGDPFPRGEFGMTLLLRVYTNDPELRVFEGRPAEGNQREYVLEWVGTTLESFD